MPAYDFACQCGNRVSIVQKITDTLKPPVCIACAKEMPRDYGAPAIKFNGAGYYSTDK